MNDTGDGLPKRDQEHANGHEEGVPSPKAHPCAIRERKLDLNAYAKTLPTTACTVAQTTLGALIQCPDGSSAVVLHGRDGVVTVTESCECPHSGAKKGHRCKE